MYNDIDNTSSFVDFSLSCKPTDRQPLITRQLRHPGSVLKSCHCRFGLLQSFLDMIVDVSPPLTATTDAPAESFDMNRSEGNWPAESFDIKRSLRVQA